MHCRNVTYFETQITQQFSTILATIYLMCFISKFSTEILKAPLLFYSHKYSYRKSPFKEISPIDISELNVTIYQTGSIIFVQYFAHMRRQKQMIMQTNISQEVNHYSLALCGLQGFLNGFSKPCIVCKQCMNDILITDHFIIT